MQKLTKKISMKEHKAMGLQFKLLYDRLLVNAMDILNNEPTKVKGRKAIRYEKKSYEAVRELSCYLEEIMYRDYPDKAVLEIYWGRKKPVKGK